MTSEILPGYDPQKNLIQDFLNNSKKTYIDMHGHSFNLDYVPEDYLQFKGLIPYLDKNRNLLTSAIEFLKGLWPFTDDDPPERMADFLLTIAKTQQDIIDEWRDGYSDHSEAENCQWAVAPQTIDFEYGYHKTPKKDYHAQIDELAELASRNAYRGKILPFVFADPRRTDLISVINHAIGECGFVGIKTYPCLGFLPSHPNLLPVWERCAELGLPVVSHYGRGGLRTNDAFIRVKGYRKKGNEYYLCNKIMFFTDQNIPVGREWKTFFNHPENWKYVLDRYRNLGAKGFKLDLAHLGDSNEVEKYRQGEEGTWFEALLNFAKEYPGFYFDVSYETHRPEIIKFICDEVLAKDDTLARKVLYGTDFFVTHGEKKFHKVVSDSLEGYTPYLEKIARQNFIDFASPR